MVGKVFDAALTRLSAGDISGKRYLLGVSGGTDSIVMAELFYRHLPELTFAVAHVNFNLRGEESDGDLVFVRRWAEERNVPFYTVSFDTLRYADEHSLSVEMAARKLRYEWFAEILDREGYDYLVIAHNLNDSVETMLLNITRGSGLKGICGIREANGKIIRPLLELSREDLEKYASCYGISHREDRTNTDVSYDRNRIRNVIIPEFRKINPGYLRTVKRDMEIFSESEEIIEEWFMEAKERICRWDGGFLSVDKGTLAMEKHGRYLLYMILREYGFNASAVSDIWNALSGVPGKKILSPTHIAFIGRDRIVLQPRKSDGGVAEISIPCEGDYTYGEYTITLRRFPKPDGFSPLPPKGTLYIDGETFSFPITCRSVRRSDRFRPLGMKGWKKISDFYTDLKLDEPERICQPILFSSSGDVIAIPPFRIDDRYKIKISTTTVMEVSIRLT